MRSGRCLQCPVLSVCNVGVLWPNGGMDQVETWHGEASAQATISSANVWLPCICYIRMACKRIRPVLAAAGLARGRMIIALRWLGHCKVESLVSTGFKLNPTCVRLEHWRIQDF